MSTDDAGLVRRCLRGDAQAIQSLVERYQSEVFGLCVRLLHHRHDAEDVAQEVFLRIFRSLKRWDSSRPLRPWIMSITVNRCKTWLGQRARRPNLVEYLHETVTSPEQENTDELTQEIQAGVAELRFEYRTVFVMFHEQNLTYDEIAQALGKPVGTVKIWLHRGRLEVLERLKKRGMISEVEHELP